MPRRNKLAPMHSKPPVDWRHLPGPGKLVKWRKRAKRSQVETADSIGIPAAKLCAFEHGRKRPCLDVAAAIQRETRGAVPATDWAQPLEDRKQRAA